MKKDLGTHSKTAYTTICLLTTIIVCLSVIPNPDFTLGQSSAPETAASNMQSATPSDIQPAEDSVLVGVWLINLFDYQYTAGDYTMDMYVYFFWTDPDLSTVDWHFANGYPITPTSVTLISSDNASAVRHEIYKATVRLSSAPDASNFPFDKINLTVSINLLPHGNDLTLMWLNNQTGVDPQFNNPGWKTDTVELTTSAYSYPLEVQVPRAEMTVIQERQRAATSFSPFFPPIIFALVSAVSFLFGLKEMGSVGLRIGLNTSMLVTTLLFSFGVSSNIPPASNMVFYAIFLLSVLIFMVCNLVVTIIGVVGWIKYRDEKRTTNANRLGFVISMIVPVAVFMFLYFVRF